MFILAPTSLMQSYLNVTKSLHDNNNNCKDPIYGRTRLTTAVSCGCDYSIDDLDVTRRHTPGTYILRAGTVYEILNFDVSLS